ncbi:ABC transporter ATP-binding protein [Oleiharenicola lentus]|uniref:ABC transporter ATP-binding protein n=1 Tax=Oleiharenicola lentus TaxID=2508720 RepID=A0A4Q1C9T1_9BACT|nr:ABC transporter ATP-binding protein [Oleiharenicola lentus]RXK55775.1 ABC transporter ATP-binding protein [Oleiharenicola lentus]
MADIPDITIEVSNLVKTYGSLTAVNHLSFTVKRGEIVGLLGPNGAGKSTTMRILTGFLPATSGSVRICGLPVASHPEATKRHVGYMPENNPLPDDMRVSEYLWFRGRLKEMPRAKLRSRIDEVLELCDLKRNRHRILGRLSKGNKQRVGIAEAILAEPAVIIMDEPTIGLDPHQIIIVRNLIASLRGRMSVIISSHILPEIEETCDRVLIINGGRIVAQGSPADLRQEIFGHTTYRIELAGDTSGLGADLTAIDPTLRVSNLAEPGPDGFIAATLMTEATSDLGEKLLHGLPARGYRLRSLGHIQPSLEDVFLAATRRSWDARLPDKKPVVQGDSRAPLPKV